MENIDLLDEINYYSIMNIVEKLCVLDTETTNSKPSQSEIVELAVGEFVNGKWNFNSDDWFYGSIQPIPYEASAINGISRNMIKDKPRFFENVVQDTKRLSLEDVDFYVAHNSKYDQEVLTKSFIDNSIDIKKFQSVRWICTMRLARKIYGNEIAQSNLPYLRYALDLPIDDEVGTHRAKEDIIVTAKLFERLISDAKKKNIISEGLGISLVEQLYVLCWEPIYMEIMPFGKHKGKKVEEIENSYWFWLLDNSESLQVDNENFDNDMYLTIERLFEKRVEVLENGK